MCFLDKTTDKAMRESKLEGKRDKTSLMFSFEVTVGSGCVCSWLAELIIEARLGDLDSVNGVPPGCVSLRCEAV